MNFRPAQPLHFSETQGVIGVLVMRQNLFESRLGLIPRGLPRVVIPAKAGIQNSNWMPDQSLPWT
jgi:hypothetical protein